MPDKAKTIKKVFTLAVFTAFLTSANFVYALEASYPTIFGLSLGDDSTFPEYAKYFFNIGIALAGFLAVIVIAFGGIYYLISSFRGSFKSEAKEWIKAGILGLLLIMCAYLIAYTINPYLVIFDLKGLAPLTFFANLFETSSPSLQIEIYTEIPIGTLTENLLTRTMACYDFDKNGDPIEGEMITTDDGRTFFGPTYLEHDKPDCFLKLAEAIEKKSNITNELSKKIAELMTPCSCSSPQSVCWSKDYKDKIKIDKIAQNRCESQLEGGDCIKKLGTCPMQKDCKFVGKSKEDCDRCPEEVVKKREEGPIKLDSETVAKGGKEDSPEVCSDKEYQGLNEFRSKFNNNYFAIKNVVEIQPPAQLKGKKISIINNGNCQVCKYKCPTECVKNDKKCEKEKKECEAERAKCQEERKKCLKENSPWHSLRLIDQLTYLKGKAEEMKQGVQEDINNLKKAESDLGRCYLADSSIDFLKIYEKTKKEDKIIIVEQTFSDPETQKIVNPAKYCEGFQFNNSTCYSQCQKVCPGTTKKEIDCYKKAPECDQKDIKARQNCLEEQAKYIKEKCYDERECISGASPFKTFPECMDNCKQQCLSACDNQTFCTVEDKESCQDECNNDSKCLIENEGICLVNFNRLKDCSDPSACQTQCKGDKACLENCKKQYNDPNFVKNCIENSASLCTYCSDQYAGYPDCVTSSYYKEGNYSSSFMCKDPDSQVCKKPQGIMALKPGEGTDNINYITCLSLNPQTAKCSATSKCPSCPCDIVTDEPLENNSNQQKNEATGTKCSEEKKGEEKEAEYRVCSPTCDKYAYNDDALTFYCKQSWWDKEETKATKPLGESLVCPKEQEIPVGQTVDDAEKWGQAFLDVMKDFTEKANDMVEYIKKIGEEKDYCKCTSQCEEGRICILECVLLMLENAPPDAEPVCIIVQNCSRNSCQKLINLLLGEEEGNKLTGNNPDDYCPQEGVKWYLEQIKESLKRVEDFVLKDKRSDILKELSYSRQKVNTCSTNYPKETRLLSCTRVEDEIIPPIIGSTQPAFTIVDGKRINSYCYGRELGAISGGEPMADNWFCCQAK